jgi:hypothetical protein
LQNLVAENATPRLLCFFGLRLGTGSARQAARKISNGVNRKSILRAQQKSHGVREIVVAV